MTRPGWIENSVLVVQQRSPRRHEVTKKRLYEKIVLLNNPAFK